MLYSIDAVGCSEKGRTLGSVRFFSLGWGYYPTSCGKVHKARATASTPGDRAFLHLGSAARNARDAKTRGRFPASLAALASLARCTVPPPTAVRCCGSCGRLVPVPAIALWSSSSAASAAWVLWCFLRRC